jgi:DNA-binding transcriptional LysR family regulator
MDLRQLRYFVTVAGERNFTRAAEKLNIAQPPLSRQIQQLEEELGVPLFERRSRPLHLTEAGRFLHEHALDVLERVEMIRTMIRRLSPLQGGRFSIGFAGSTLYGALPDLVRRFRAAFPGVEITLLELSTLQQIAALKEGTIDVGFGRLRRLEDPAIKREILREEPLMVALPLGHPLLDRLMPLRLDDLAQEPLILYPKEPRPSYADQVLAIYQGRSLEPGAVHEVSGLQTALGLVAAGVGLCLVPACVQQLRRDDVLYRGLDEKEAVSSIIMSYRKQDRSRQITVTMELIREMYQQWGLG